MCRLYRFTRWLLLTEPSAKKDKEQQKLLAVTLVAERDPAAEVFLTEIQYRIKKDPAIQSLLLQHKDDDAIEYIRQSYFNTYFRKYLLQIYVGHSHDNLIIQPDDREVSCRPFMDNQIEAQGLQIPGTSFYFMDNMNGTNIIHRPFGLSVGRWRKRNYNLYRSGFGFIV